MRSPGCLRPPLGSCTEASSIEYGRRITISLGATFFKSWACFPSVAFVTQVISSWFIPPSPFLLFMTPPTLLCVLSKDSQGARLCWSIESGTQETHWKKAEPALPFSVSDVMWVSSYCEADWGHRNFLGCHWTIFRVSLMQRVHPMGTLLSA